VAYVFLPRLSKEKKEKRENERDSSALYTYLTISAHWGGKRKRKREVWHTGRFANKFNQPLPREKKGGGDERQTTGPHIYLSPGKRKKKKKKIKKEGEGRLIASAGLLSLIF